MSDSASTTNGFGAPSAANAKPIHVPAPQGGTFVLDRSELVRLMVDELRALGHVKSAAMLEQESGTTFESRSVSSFRAAVMAGNWADALACIRDSGPASLQVPAHVLPAVLFAIKEQQYLEQLESGDTPGALMTLRGELAPLQWDDARLHELSSFLMFPTADDLRAAAQWPGAGPESRAATLAKVQSYVPPTVMVRSRRLEHLVAQALAAQEQACACHIGSDETDADGSGPLRRVSLFSDHSCDAALAIPTECVAVLADHEDEVWFAAFSHAGTRIAGGSKDGSTIVWDVTSRSVVYRLLGHDSAVAYLAWSPDDAYLATCGNDNSVRLWNMATGQCTRVLTRHDESVTACAWLSNGQHFVTGGLDKKMVIWDMNGNVVHQWTGHRITDLQASRDGRYIVTASNGHIRVYDVHTHAEIMSFSESESVTSLSLSKDDRYLLTNTAGQELHVWQLFSGAAGGAIPDPVLVRRYVGHKQGKFVIRSTFGGPGDAFLVSGSEDNKAYVWHRGSGEVVSELAGHTATVNSACWNPTITSMVATCSDDGTIRLYVQTQLTF
ncbi:WD40-repeat-containing domain protein [Blastocladiella britannica]|nr:WD40-repeat-containing domain protein [Blastocladiella britannica]